MDCGPLMLSTMLHTRGAGVEWLCKHLCDDLAVLKGPLSGFEAWGEILWQAHKEETAKRNGDAWWSSHNEGKHRLFSGAAFMEAISNAEAMRSVDFTAQILAPPTLRALLAKRSQCDRSRRTSKKDALRRISALPCKHPEQQLLYMLALRNFSPKLLVSQTPEVYALVNAMEKVASMLLAAVFPMGETVHGSPAQLSDAELRGVACAFLGFPLAVKAVVKDGKVGYNTAQGYNSMDKGRNFLQWGYVSGRFKHTALNSGMYDWYVKNQSVGKAHVTEAMSFFSITSHTEFEKMRGVLSDIVPVATETDHGSGKYVHGDIVTWPSVFIHICEIKQAVNTLSLNLVRAIAFRHQTYADKDLLAKQQKAGVSGECFAVELLRHEQTLRRRCKRKVPEYSAGQKQQKKIHIKQKEEVKEKEEAVEVKQEQETDHGSTCELVQCSCSGMCAKGAPSCPARRAHITGDPTHRCPNMARIVRKLNKRHFCDACRCRYPGCDRGRRRGAFCGEHRDEEMTGEMRGNLHWFAVVTLPTQSEGTPCDRSRHTPTE